MSSAETFRASARWYARYRPTYPSDLLEGIANLAPRRAWAWDCGTGSGQAASLLAPHFEGIIATDVSLAQLAGAARSEGVVYAVCAAEETCLPTGNVDCIVCAQSIHWFDLDRFFHEVRRVARSGALICAMGYGRAQINGPIGTRLKALYHEMFVRHYSRQRSLIESAYTTIPFPFDELPGIAFSIHAQWGVRELVGYVRSWSSVQEEIRTSGQDPTVAFADDVAVLMKAGERHDVFFPGFTRLGYVDS